LAFVRADHRSAGITSLKHGHAGGSCPTADGRTGGLVTAKPPLGFQFFGASVVFHLHWHILAVENGATVFWNGRVPARRI